MSQTAQRTKFAAGHLTFVVKHELWDGNIDDLTGHPGLPLEPTPNLVSG